MNKKHSSDWEDIKEVSQLTLGGVLASLSLVPLMRGYTIVASVGVLVALLVIVKTAMEAL